MVTLNFKNKLDAKQLLFLLFMLGVAGCGRAYFPIELETVSRNDRLKGQTKEIVNFLPMTKNTVKSANQSAYKRMVIEGGDFNNPAKIIPAGMAIKEFLPPEEVPGPYLVGPGDRLLFSQIFSDSRNQPSLISRPITVSDSGYVNIYEIGRIKASGLTQSALEDKILAKMFAEGLGAASFELEILEFNSKKIYLYKNNAAPSSIPYTNKSLYLEDLMSGTPLNVSRGADAKITLHRGERKYIFSLSKAFQDVEKKYRLFPDDRVYLEPLIFRPERVLIVGETGAQRSVTIDPFLRPSLADTIFSGSVLNNITSDFSQIYVLRRERNSEFSAYHLDITNPSRINLASNFEMRPDDIVFVAPQPLTIYSRALQQMLGSYDITAQARDSVKSELQ